MDPKLRLLEASITLTPLITPNVTHCSVEHSVFYIIRNLLDAIFIPLHNILVKLGSEVSFPVRKIRKIQDNVTYAKLTRVIC